MRPAHSDSEVVQYARRRQCMSMILDAVAHLSLRTRCSNALLPCARTSPLPLAPHSTPEVVVVQHLEHLLCRRPLINRGGHKRACTGGCGRQRRVGGGAVLVRRCRACWEGGWCACVYGREENTESGSQWRVLCAQRSARMDRACVHQELSRVPSASRCFAAVGSALPAILLLGVCCG